MDRSTNSSGPSAFSSVSTCPSTLSRTAEIFFPVELGQQAGRKGMHGEKLTIKSVFTFATICTAILLVTLYFKEPQMANNSLERLWNYYKPPRNTSVLIVSMCEDNTHDPYGARLGTWMNTTMTNHRSYAQFHGYHYLVKTKNEVSGINARHQKAAFLLEALALGYEWTFWTDCDTLFMNFSKPLSDFTSHNASLVISGDRNCAMNLGQLIMRNKPWIRDMLRFASQCEINHPCGVQCHMGGDQKIFNFFVWGDCETSWGNYARGETCNKVIRSAKREYRDDIHCEQYLASYPDHFENPSRHSVDPSKLFRLHFAGPQSTKLKLVRKWSERVTY